MLRLSSCSLMVKGTEPLRSWGVPGIHHFAPFYLCVLAWSIRTRTALFHDFSVVAILSSTLASNTSMNLFMTNVIVALLLFLL